MCFQKFFENLFRMTLREREIVLRGKAQSLVPALVTDKRKNKEHRRFILVRSYNQELRPVPSSEGFSLSTAVFTRYSSQASAGLQVFFSSSGIDNQVFFTIKPLQALQPSILF